MRAIRLMIVGLLLAATLSGCVFPERGVFVTACEQRKTEYACATVWVRPVPLVERGDYAFEWSCVRPENRHTRRVTQARWLKEW
jgi:hypothetical protein